jgi:hypothetical protein
MEKDYKKLCEEYERRMGIGEDDPAKEGYIVLVDILRQQNRYLKTVVIKDLITTEDKTKAASEYERAKALWEKLPTMIQSVSTLRLELKMEGEAKKTQYSPISAKEIANGNV